ncbi:3-succinylated cholic acid synthase [Bacteroides sp. 51]|uniref:3-succinylated cholic acid synthase n=1 Tax=Bacteroides sp. 51 TaxID=2302938 RepID=UPI0013D279AC|nr:serine hydrolase [Bacteroides sp. 51]NDV84824.1 class C beta-lactamase-related serine hydrolase [Bacteroides sp. 51]
MRNIRYILLLSLYLFIPATLCAQVNELPRSTPEAEGVPSRAVIALFDSLTALPKTDIHSVMVIRHGKVIGEIYPAPFAPEYNQTVYSCSKTFVGAAVGLAIADNRLRLTDRVATFFPELLPDSISDNLAAMTVRNLLNMSSGITPDWDMRNHHSDWLRMYLAKPVKTPGKQFDYDSMSAYVLSAIVQKVTGMTLLDYLKLKLFTPMNITDVAWEVSPEGFNTGGWGLYIQSESLAKFGLLLLNQGMWEGKQLLPASWVKEMTSKQMDSYDDESYGYLLWLCEYPGSVCVDGALGQYVLIAPDKDMVVVITECTLINGRNQRRLVWNRLLPEAGDTSLTPGKDYKLLQKKQTTYQLPVAQGRVSSRVARNYTGKNILLESNKYGWQSLSLQFNPREIVMTVTEKNGAVYDLVFGYKQWLKTLMDSYPPYSINPVDRFKGIDGPFRVAGSYGWQSFSTLQLKAHYVNWISALGITFQFDEDSILLNITENFSSDKITIKGKMVSCISS